MRRLSGGAGLRYPPIQRWRPGCCKDSTPLRGPSAVSRARWRRRSARSAGRSYGRTTCVPRIAALETKIIQLEARHAELIEAMVIEIRIDGGIAYPISVSRKTTKTSPTRPQRGNESHRFAQWWGGWGSNPRPADYEKYGLMHRAR